ncbi:sterol desaturase family protein [Natronospirillum operosum]|uniref:Sterol desaturase family protein n=1 Tax=Natronospirillum operosum TaxID=2759953 RepID=A0A4Z0WGH7_9GAMM|nr:sterol desaturase family protein [Natronospirillum operosum]TGG93888.1 sterol desaturase family protein [Natronospirillum operosum]
MKLDTLALPGRLFLERFLLPFLVMASMGAFLLARDIGADLDLVVMAATVAALLVAMAAERLIPFRRDWNRSHQDGKTDLTSAAVLVAAVEPMLKYLAPVAAVALYALLDGSGVYHDLLGQLPFAVQLIAVTLLIELGRYWSHRLHHRIPQLWWLHAMHHSSERLYAFNNLRFHPLNHALNFIMGSFPLLLIGAPPEILLGYLALTQPVVMLQHANVASRHGLLNYLFSTNELHRWHHSSKASEANCNYGTALIIWDQVFGTFRYRADGNMPEAVGLFSGSRQHYPAQASYLTQLKSMLSPRCCAA